MFPNFGGTWAGSEVVTRCEDSDVFWEGFCDEFSPVGDVFFHASTLTQTEASVDAVLDMGGGASARMTGTITVAGLLQLPSAPVLPADSMLNLQVQNWRSQADVPSQMTGTYDILFTAPGIPGSVRYGVRLQDVVRTSAPTAPRSVRSSTGGGTVRERARRWIANHP